MSMPDQVDIQGGHEYSFRVQLEELDKVEITGECSLQSALQCRTADP